MTEPDLRPIIVATLAGAAVGGVLGAVAAWTVAEPGAAYNVPGPQAPGPVAPEPETAWTIDGEFIDCGSGALAIDVGYLATVEVAPEGGPKWFALDERVGRRCAASVHAGQAKYRGLPDGLLDRVVLIGAGLDREHVRLPAAGDRMAGAALVAVTYAWYPDQPEYEFHREIGRRLFDRFAATETGRRWRALHAESRDILPYPAPRGDPDSPWQVPSAFLAAGFVARAATESPREDFAAFHAATWMWGGSLNPGMRKDLESRWTLTRSRFELLESAERDLGLLGPGESLRYELPVSSLPWMRESERSFQWKPASRVALRRRAEARCEPVRLR